MIFIINILNLISFIHGIDFFFLKLFHFERWNSQVVGWPPIRAYRMNTMVNQAKSLAAEEFNSVIVKNKSKNTVVEKTDNGSNMNNGTAKFRTSIFVKVNMDGIPIGRKVDLNAHGCYETLAQTLEDMFLKPTTNINPIREFFSSFLSQSSK